MEVLKPCPICKGKAKLYKHYIGLYQIRCTRCPMTLTRTTAVEAIIDWNEKVERMMNNG